VKGKLKRHTSDPILTFATVKSTPAQRQNAIFQGNRAIGCNWVWGGRL